VREMRLERLYRIQLDGGWKRGRCDDWDAIFPGEVWLTHGKLQTPNIDKLYGIVYFVKG
jgi:hypothetical protein